MSRRIVDLQLENRIEELELHILESIWNLEEILCLLRNDLREVKELLQMRPPSRQTNQQNKHPTV